MSSFLYCYYQYRFDCYDYYYSKIATIVINIITISTLIVIMTTVFYSPYHYSLLVIVAAVVVVVVAVVMVMPTMILKIVVILSVSALCRLSGCGRLPARPGWNLAPRRQPGGLLQEGLMY